MSAEDHKQALPPGFRLGAYRVARVLGVGGFGVTYLCEHTGLAVQVAVKEYLPNEIAVRDGTEVHPKSAGDRGGFEWGLGRFLDEARTLARFEHPNVVRVRDCFEANNTAYIVMDYEEGEPLDRLLQRLGTLTEGQLKRVLLPVVDGLRQVHAAGFLHRDIKPANIFVRRSDESPVLLDFGSARQALGRRSRSVTAIASAGYSPPEQYESDGHQGTWTDIYALSALCYRAITGDVPMEATRRQSQLLRTQTDPLPKLANIGSKGYSPDFLEAVDRGLCLIDTERPQSLDEWLPRLERANALPSRDSELTLMEASRHPSPTAARRTAQPPRRQRRHQTAKLARRPSRASATVGWLVAGSLLLVLGILWLGVGLLGDESAVERIERIVDNGPPSSGLRGDVPRWNGRIAPGNLTERFEDWLSNRLRGDAPRYGRGTASRRTAHRRPSSMTATAVQGDASAQCDLGSRYYRGDGVPKDAGKASVWYRKAAEQGLEGAQFILGYMYEIGDGVPKDAGQAAVWYRKAALRGLANAQYNLGLLYYKGEGVSSNLVQSYAWLSLGAENGNEDALYFKTIVYERMHSMQHIEAYTLLMELKRDIRVPLYRQPCVGFSPERTPANSALSAG